MQNPDDFFRSFGMSGYLITEELKNIEQRFNLELGHTPRSINENPLEYYPQFEQAVRSEAAAMARHYELFYCLEKSIRKLISETLHEKAGADWWNSGLIPGEIVENVKKLVKKEMDNGVTIRSESLIDYTTFGELAVIINANWNIFDPIFSNRRAVEKIMNSLNMLRGPIAHCCPLPEDEIARLRLTVKDWFRMIG